MMPCKHNLVHSRRDTWLAKKPRELLLKVCCTKTRMCHCPRVYKSVFITGQCRYRCIRYFSQPKRPLQRPKSKRWSFCMLRKSDFTLLLQLVAILRSTVIWCLFLAETLRNLRPGFLTFFFSEQQAVSFSCNW